MLREETMKAREPMLIMSRGRDYAQLMKPNLSIMVVFTSVVGYLLAPGIHFAWREVLILFAGGMLVTGGANTINQILEVEGDALMQRTMVRPLPDKRITTLEAWIFAAISGIGGAALIGYNFNALAGILSFVSLLLYAFAYTPMKRIHPVAVLIGAIPGAFPPLLGWIAATGTLGVGGWVLFLVQFFWQFPHYWAIGWLGYDEYKKAGISMLPSQERSSKFTAMQCMFYSVVLIPIAIIPCMMHMISNTGMWIGMAAGAMYFIVSLQFFRKNDQASAKRVLYTSFFYLPLVMLAFLFTKL